MSSLHHLAKGQLDEEKIQILKLVLNKMMKSAPLHIRVPVYFIELMVILYCLTLFWKFIVNLDERESIEFSRALENSRFQGFRMIVKLQKSATYLVMYE